MLFYVTTTGRLTVMKIDDTKSLSSMMMEWHRTNLHDFTSRATHTYYFKTSHVKKYFKSSKRRLPAHVSWVQVR